MKTKDRLLYWKCVSGEVNLFQQPDSCATSLKLYESKIFLTIFSNLLYQKLYSSLKTNLIIAVDVVNLPKYSYTVKASVNGLQNFFQEFEKLVYNFLFWRCKGRNCYNCAPYCCNYI